MASLTPTSHPRARPLRVRLLLLAASGLLPLVIVLVWGLNHLLEERRAAAEVSVMELSRALSTAVDAELRSVMTLLHHMSNSDGLERADLHDFHETAERTAEQLGWNYIALADSEGRVLLRTNEPYGKATPHVGRARQHGPRHRNTAAGGQPGHRLAKPCRHRLHDTRSRDA